MLYIFLADGFEEIEALAPVDVLRRAGLTVKTVGVGGDMITGSHGITVKCDLTSYNITISDDLQGVILPGGMPGTVNLEKNSTVQSFIDFAYENGKLVCAICAAPSILGHKGILNGKEATCFPGFETELDGARLSPKYVVRDGNVITARGMGVAVDFGLEIVSAILGSVKADEIKGNIQSV